MEDTAAKVRLYENDIAWEVKKTPTSFTFIMHDSAVGDFTDTRMAADFKTLGEVSRDTVHGMLDDFIVQFLKGK